VRYLRKASIAITNPPQSQPLNQRQVKNSAGGYSFPVDEWKRLDRFLILGSEGGSYYASEQKLTQENAEALAACVQKDGPATVRRIVEISEQGRAPKNDPALFALAYASAKGNAETRAAALDALPRVARIGTHLFHFADFVNAMRGWGRGLRRGVGDWYKLQPLERLAEQATKYQSRDGWSHDDLLRLCHVRFADPERNAIARWIHGGAEAVNRARELKDRDGQVIRIYGPVDAELPSRIEGHIKLQAAATASQAARLIREYGLVRESVPTELLKEKEVWQALLEDMPMTAMIRNLGNLSKCGLLTPMSTAAGLVIERLNEDALKKARVHPIQILIAQKTYAAGRGSRGAGIWTPVPQVVDALDDAFYAAFKTITPTGKRFYLGLDVSGSMSVGSVAGVEGLTPRAASSAMAMVTARSEKQYYIAAFQDRMVELSISLRQRLDDICKKTERLPFGATDCAQPMLDALARRIPVDVFAVYTDSETWCGQTHPTVALARYRQAMGIAAKLVVVGMVSSGFTIADPDDGGMLDVVGFDAATPQVISQFAES
jgi:60 kDa SS-A/Ro ribonucleoprotein